MRRAIEFMREQRVVVARWVAMDEDYLNVVRERGDNDASEALRLQGQSNVRRNEAVRAAKIADRIRRLIEEE